MNGNLLSLSEFGKRLFDLRIRAGYKVPKELLETFKEIAKKEIEAYDYMYN